MEHRLRTKYQKLNSDAYAGNEISLEEEKKKEKEETLFFKKEKKNIANMKKDT